MLIDEEDIQDDISKVEFKKLVSDEKRHKEISSLLRQLISVSNENKISDNSLEIRRLIFDFTNKLKEVSNNTPELPIPQVTVQTDNSAIEELANNINTNLTELIRLQSEKQKWEFEIIRGYGGQLTKLIAKPKT